MIYKALRFDDPALVWIPPMLLYPQLWWALSSSLSIRLTHGRNHALWIYFKLTTQRPSLCMQANLSP
jgi:hypothetical protein